MPTDLDDQTVYTDAIRRVEQSPYLQTFLKLNTVEEKAIFACSFGCAHVATWAELRVSVNTVMSSADARITPGDGGVGLVHNPMQWVHPYSRNW